MLAFERVSEKSEASFEVGQLGFILAQLHSQLPFNNFFDKRKGDRKFFRGLRHDDEVVCIADKLIPGLFKLLIDNVTDKVRKKGRYDSSLRSTFGCLVQNALFHYSRLEHVINTVQHPSIRYLFT